MGKRSCLMELIGALIGRVKIPIGIGHPKHAESQRAKKRRKPRDLQRMEPDGIEPTTPALQRQCSPN
jgi:hypothetical protein